MERIGIKSIDIRDLINVRSSIIKEVLLFDKIYYHKEQVIEFGKAILKDQFTQLLKIGLKTLDELENKEIIKDISTDHTLSINYKDIPFDASINKLLAPRKQAVEYLQSTGQLGKAGEIMLEIVSLAIDYFTREYSSCFKGEAICTPLLNNANLLLPDSIEDKKKQDVLSVVINSIPTISPEVSLSKLKEFKTDNDIRSSFLALRDYMIELSKSSFNSDEMYEKIEYLLDRYEKQLKLHKTKLEYSTLQTFFIAGAEALENILHLKPSKALKVILDVRKKEIELLDAEQRFVGREVAYIHNIKAKLT